MSEHDPAWPDQHDICCPRAALVVMDWDRCACSVARQARADEREKIAKAIEDYPALVGRLTAARIARSGGSDV